MFDGVLDNVVFQLSYEYDNITFNKRIIFEDLRSKYALAVQEEIFSFHEFDSLTNQYLRPIALIDENILRPLNQSRHYYVGILSIKDKLFYLNFLSKIHFSTETLQF